MNPAHQITSYGQGYSQGQGQGQGQGAAYPAPSVPPQPRPAVQAPVEQQELLAALHEVPRSKREHLLPGTI